jgi:hypothetical protein
LEDGSEVEQQNVRSRWRLVILIVVAVLVVLLILLWSARKPIARNYMDRMLARNQVPAQYKITHFGFRRQRLEHVVIGDPRAPDLTADWVEVGFGVSGLWPSVRMLRAHGLRVDGRIVDGKLSLGALDRLMPAASGEPFALPQLYLALDNARMRLETPAGAIGLALTGQGNLAGGFMGRMAGIAKQLAVGGCVIEQPVTILHIATADRQPAIDGPLRAQKVTCGSGSLENPRTAIDVSLNSRFDRWRGGAVIAAGRIASGPYGAGSLKARISFAGTGEASDARLTGSFEALQVGEIGRNLQGFEGTPLGPLVVALRKAVDAATKHVDVDASLHLASAGGNRTLHIAPLSISSSSGAQLVLQSSGKQGLSWRWPGGAMKVDGKIALSGGGFPESILRVQQADDRLEGKLWMEPFAAGGARLAIDPLSFGDGRFATRVRMDGPVADGRIVALDFPVAGRIGPRIVVNANCAPLSFALLEIAGTRIGPTRLMLCPLGAAAFSRTANGGINGGASIASPVLRGRIGDQPLLLSAQRFRASVKNPRFVLDNFAARLGTGPDPTRLNADLLTGDLQNAAIVGSIAKVTGKIDGVPLLVSNGAGHWSLRGSALHMAGSLDLDAAGPDPRFSRLTSKNASLDLKGGRITGAATLLHPQGGQLVTRVSLAHNLASGQGHASLDVPGITFAKNLQPEMLTRLTLGVIADARGTVAGNGRIDWGRDRVASTGDFSTGKMDFAAAFGPVTGLAGKIHFSDLLGMETPPGQMVTIGAVNPGVAVENGVVHYQLLPDQVVRIEDGRWPFSGGELLLDPTSLDFGKPSDRFFTFQVRGMDAALFVQQFEFKNIAVTGTFDGVLPMIFDVHGGRIEGGRLVVRESGGTLAYVGELSNEQLGRFGNMAFDALKSIRYSNLAIELNGSLDGEIVSKVIFSGTNEAPIETRKGLLGGLVGLPFKFNIRITAPFRSLVNSAQSINDPRGLVKGALEQRRASEAAKISVQPDESEKVR